jgi:hypothetical protein
LVFRPLVSTWWSVLDVLLRSTWESHFDSLELLCLSGCLRKFQEELFT